MIIEEARIHDYFSVLDGPHAPSLHSEKGLSLLSGLVAQLFAHVAGHGYRFCSE